MSDGADGKVDEALAKRAEVLDGVFYLPGAREHRERLQLQIAERRAREEIAEATGIHDLEVLSELAGLGIRVDTLAALTLIPLIDVAWCDGEMDAREREAVLEAAVGTGIERGSVSYQLLEIWMVEQPPQDLVVAWRRFIEALQAQLDDGQARRMAEKILGRAREVAAAAGDALNRSPHISQTEESCLAALAEAFDR